MFRLVLILLVLVSFVCSRPVLADTNYRYFGQNSVNDKLYMKVEDKGNLKNVCMVTLLSKVNSQGATEMGVKYIINCASKRGKINETYGYDIKGNIIQPQATAILNKIYGQMGMNNIPPGSLLMQIYDEVCTTKSH